VREVAIAEVGLDDERRVFVRPAEGDFEHVYRAGMEVCWDKASRRLSHPQPPRDWTPVRWFQQIVAAVAGEYGVLLKLTAHSDWIAVPTDLRTAIEAEARAKSR